MKYLKFYKTPSGFDNIIILSDGKFITGLFFKTAGGVSEHLQKYEEKSLPIFEKAALWLDIYFGGAEPDFTPEYKLENLTPFTMRVMESVKKIPYGNTATYGDIANEIAKERNIKKMSAQAVGGAVGSNPICIIIPCHRVVGCGGKITGYGGGVKNKKGLLEIESKVKSRFQK